MDVITLYLGFITVVSLAYMVYNILAFFGYTSKAYWFVPAIMLFATSIVASLMLLVPHNVTCIVTMNSTLSPVAKPVYTNTNGIDVILMVLSSMTNFISLITARLKK